MPEVSVIMSVYNGERYLAQAIESILNQAFTDFEFLILDDCSTDSSPVILQNFASRDSRLKILRNEQNLGLTKSLNRGLQAAQGKYIARQDADDISLPTRLAEQVEFLNNHPGVVLVSGNIEQIDANGNTVGFLNRAAPPFLIRWYMLFYNHVSGHSQVMFRRDSALKVGGYNENRPYSQDYELWLKLLHEGEIAMLPRTWLKWRTHGENISSQKFRQQEQLSLSDSQRELSQLLGYELDSDTVAQLRGFWLEPFPPLREVGKIYRLLTEIYAAFVASEKQSTGNATDSMYAVPTGVAGTRYIASVISAQFFRWARAVSIRKHPRAKLKLWLYAWRWKLKF